MSYLLWLVVLPSSTYPGHIFKDQKIVSRRLIFPSICQTYQNLPFALLAMAQFSLYGFHSGSVVKNLPPMQETLVLSLGPEGSRSRRRRKWQPTPIFLPGKSHGERSPRGYSPWNHKSQTQLRDKTTQQFYFPLIMLMRMLVTLYKNRLMVCITTIVINQKFVRKKSQQPCQTIKIFPRLRNLFQKCPWVLISPKVMLLIPMLLISYSLGKNSGT